MDAITKCEHIQRINIKSLHKNLYFSLKRVKKYLTAELNVVFTLSIKASKEILRPSLKVCFQWLRKVWGAHPGPSLLSPPVLGPQGEVVAIVISVPNSALVQVAFLPKIKQLLKCLQHMKGLCKANHHFKI